MKNFGVLITYYWFNDINIFINKYKNFNLDKRLIFYLIVNGSNNNQIQLLKKKLNNFNLIDNRKFNSISRGFNIAVRALKKKNIEIITLLDQDSKVDENFFEQMYKYSFDQNTYTVIGPKIIDINTNLRQRLTLLHKYHFKFINFDKWPNRKYIRTDFVINSGMTIKLINLQDFKFWDENLKIDSVDTDLCLNLRSKGHLIAVLPEIYLKHSLGNRQKKNLFNLTFFPSFHSKERRYEICYSTMYLIFKYPFIGNILLQITRLAHELLTILFFENDKLGKLKFCLKGIVKALNDRSH